MRVIIITRYPWFILYGGCELQASKYVSNAASIDLDVRLADHYDPRAEADIIHFVGISHATFSAVEVARQRGMATVVSPVYYTTPAKEALLSVLMRLPCSSSLLAPALYRRAFRAAKLLLPNSQAELKQLVRIFGVSPHHTAVLHNGVDQPDPDVDPNLFLRTYGISSDYILSVAMVDERKNTLQLMRGFLEANLPNTKLVIVGGCRTNSSSYYERVTSLCRANPNRIQMIGFITDRKILDSAYKGARVHALPSHFETPGLSSLEAATYGCNLVVGECAPVREYFGDVPFYCDSLSASSIAEALTASVREDRGAVGSAMAKEFYWPSIGSRLSELYRAIRSSGPVDESG